MLEHQAEKVAIWLKLHRAHEVTFQKACSREIKQLWHFKLLAESQSETGDDEQAHTEERRNICM